MALWAGVAGRRLGLRGGSVAGPGSPLSVGSAGRSLVARSASAAGLPDAVLGKRGVGGSRVPGDNCSQLGLEEAATQIPAAGGAPL